jgi:hypothetical protein
MRTLALMLLSCIFLGCPKPGVTFDPLRLTNDLPDTFKKRNLYPDESGILKYKLTELVGRVIYKTPSTEYYSVKKVILNPDYSPVIELISDADGQVFEGLVDRNAALKGSYLAFASDLSVKEVATVSIRDRHTVIVKNKDIPRDSLVAEAEAVQKDSLTRRFWVQGAMLTSLDVARFSEISANASGVVGATFGAEGHVYNKQSQGIHDYRISVLLIDLDGLEELTKRHSILPITELLKDPEVLKGLQATGIVIAKVQEPKMK